jgi:hypothetical protein
MTEKLSDSMDVFLIDIMTKSYEVYLVGGEIEARKYIFDKLKEYNRAPMGKDIN